MHAAPGLRGVAFKDGHEILQKRRQQASARQKARHLDELQDRAMQQAEEGVDA
jgi:hypothetical protein